MIKSLGENYTQLNFDLRISELLKQGYIRVVA